MMRSCLALALSLTPAAAGAISVQVRVHPDTARAVSADIPVTGGTITATAADGTIITLTIPPKALLSSERITVTPVALIERLPMSGLAAGVQLEPSGLQLWKRATLTFKTPVPVTLDAEALVAWSRSGDNFHLYPPEITPDVVTLKLMHFSGMGVARSTSSERAVQLNSVPCDEEAALTQRLAGIIGPEAARQRAGMPADASVFDQVVAIVQDYFNTTMKQAMNAALQSKNDQQLEAMISRANRFLQHYYLYTHLEETDPFIAAATAVVNQFQTNALEILSDNALNRCLQNKPEEIQSLISFEKRAEYLGLSPNLRTKEKVERCGKFELIFDSSITMTVSQAQVSFVETMKARSVVRMTMTVGASEPYTAPLNYTFNLQYTVQGVNCTVTDSRGIDSIFTVLSAEPDMNPKKEDDPCPSKRRAAGSSPPDRPHFKITSMLIDIGSPSETASVTCAGQSIPLQLDHDFNNAWHDLHAEENKGGNRYEIKDWQEVTTAGSLKARKVYKQGSQHGVARWDEDTILGLFHSP